MKEVFSAKDILDVTGAEILLGDINCKFPSISTDTRTIKPGELFWALKGERFNGNDFVLDALQKGAKGAVVCDTKVLNELDDLSRADNSPLVLYVKDSLRALDDFAAFWRKKLGLNVVAITGSCGKTTTKELLYLVLSSIWPTEKTKGNFNNLIGLPLTIFSIPKGTKWAILELGINQEGEMEKLIQIASPNVGIITQIAPSHLEGLGTLEKVAKEKGRLFESIGKDGLCIVNLDNEWIINASKRAKAPLVGYSLYERDFDTRDFESIVRCISFKPEGFNTLMLFDFDGKRYDFLLPLIGSSNVQNTLCAAASSYALGIDPIVILGALSVAKTLPGRLNIQRISDNFVVIDDTYNANPASMIASLEALSKWAQGNKIAILGDMLELGKEESKLHEQVGRKVAELGIDFLITVGKLSKNISLGAREAGLSPNNILHYEEVYQLLDGLKDLLDKLIKSNNDSLTILVKASRRLRLERIVEKLLYLAS